MKITMGIDPDSKDLAFATWDEAGPRDVRVLHVTGSASNYEMLDELREWPCPFERRSWSPSCIAIEGQQIDRRRTGKGDLFKLAHITGAAALWCRRKYPHSRMLIPTPAEWKGKLKKAVHQARLYDNLGWGYETIGKDADYSRPLRIPARFGHITKGQWKHCGDALLLAKWAYEQAL